MSPHLTQIFVVSTDDDKFKFWQLFDGGYFVTRGEFNLRLIHAEWETKLKDNGHYEVSL